MAEDNPRQTKVIIGVLVVFLIGFVFAMYKASQDPTGPHAKGKARCIMHGMIYPKYDTQKQTSLSDMIRLHFDVKDPEDKEKCEQLIESYCYHNVLETQYMPTKLEASFKPDMDGKEETFYTFSETCALHREER